MSKHLEDINLNGRQPHRDKFCFVCLFVFVFVSKQIEKSFSISNGFDTDFARGFAPSLENNDVITSQCSKSSKMVGKEEIMVRTLENKPGTKTYPTRQGLTMVSTSFPGLFPQKMGGAGWGADAPSPSPHFPDLDGAIFV